MTQQPVPATDRPRRRALVAALVLALGSATMGLAAACSSPVSSAVRALETARPSSAPPSSSLPSSSPPLSTPKASSATWTATACPLTEDVLASTSPGDWVIEGPDSDGECTYDNSEGDHVGSTSQDDNGDPHGTIAGLLMFCADPKPAPSVDPDAYTCVWTTDDVPTLVGIVKRPSHVVMLVSLISGTTPTAKELALMTSWLKTAR